ncbi:MAG: hypothetical protein IH945_13535 [Armatimonadetes bacterium]|nr:hypothetical protein [Armatimonadota bacterium]
MIGLFGVAVALVASAPITTAHEGPGPYLVAKLAANGFPCEDDTYEKLLGTRSAGGLAELALSDDRFLDVDSSFLAGVGHYASIRADFNIVEPAATVTELGITVEAHFSSGTRALGTIFAYNWTLDEYEYVKVFSLRTSGNEPKLLKIEKNADDYISSCGDVRIVVRAHCSFIGSVHHAPFRLSIDLVNLDVRATKRSVLQSTVKA